jgi:hypothetical protein
VLGHGPLRSIPSGLAASRSRERFRGGRAISNNQGVIALYVHCDLVSMVVNEILRTPHELAYGPAPHRNQSAPVRHQSKRPHDHPACKFQPRNTLLVNDVQRDTRRLQKAYAGAERLNVDIRAG